MPVARLYAVHRSGCGEADPAATAICLDDRGAVPAVPAYGCRLRARRRLGERVGRCGRDDARGGEDDRALSRLRLLCHAFRRDVQLVEHRSDHRDQRRSEEHTSELQSLLRTSYAVFCCKTKNTITEVTTTR